MKPYKLMGLMLAVIIFVCSLCFIPDQTSKPLEAAPNWTLSPVTIGGEKYIIDSFVLNDGTVYKMWYTHLTLTLSVDQLFNQIKTLQLDDLLAALWNYHWVDFTNHLVDLNPSLPTIIGILNNLYVEIGYATSADGKDWTIVDSSVLTGAGPSFLTSVGFPTVMKVDTNDYRMWFTKVDSSLNQAQLQTIFTNMGSVDPVVKRAAINSLLNSTRTVIGYATSADGISWAVQNPAAFSGSGNAFNMLNSVGAPSVILDGAVYKMWYTQIKTDFDNAALDGILLKAGSNTLTMDDLLSVIDSTSLVIGYTESLDGSTWSNGSEVFSGGPSLWQSVFSPFVIKSGSSYTMWFTAANSNLNNVNALRSVLHTIGGMNIPALWNTFKTGDFATFVTNLISTDITGLQTLLGDSYCSIGITGSGDGASWAIPSTDLTRSVTNQFGGVGNPSVIKSLSQTELWYTQGFPSLTWQSIVDWLLGVGPSSGLGYAKVTSLIIIGGGGAPPPISGVGEVCYPLTPSGYTTVDITLESEDEKCTIVIPKTTLAQTAAGGELKCIYCTLVTSPPKAPEGKVILAAYELKPDGAFFDKLITISMKYNAAALPKGTSESDLKLAYNDTDVAEWKNLSDIVVDTKLHQISGKTDHFTVFGIISNKESEEPVVKPPTPPIPPEQPKPAAFVTSILTITPETIKPGETVSIDVTVTNVGEQAGTYTVKLFINDTVAQTQDVTLRPGTSEIITFSVSGLTVGEYRVEINNLHGSFVVKEVKIEPTPESVPEFPEPQPLNWLLIAIGVMIGVTIGVLAGWFIIRRKENIK